uniref:glucuronosyltransferase n=1 Tax=Syphacia muris TaxID=451379 RepID=A0A0N5AEY5_9BILA
MYLLFVISLLLVQSTNALTILFFLIGTTQFERSIFEFMAQQLALRNHNTITVKPILIPEEPRLVKPKLHLVREKTLKNLLPKLVFFVIGSDVPWRKTYEYEAFQLPYYAAHNHSCYKMINSNLMDTLKKDNIDVAIVYSGNPCQLGILQTLQIPFIYFDLEGFTAETIIASKTPLNLNIPPSNCHFPPVKYLQRYINGICYLREYLTQSGIPWIGRLLSQRYKFMDYPITKQFREDYELRKKHGGNFPDVNKIKQNAELYFINTDRLLEYDYAYPPNVITVGGVHIDRVKPLFHPWNTTLSASEKGTIVVTLGTQADSSSMTAAQFHAIYGALKTLTSYRIYWRLGPKFQHPELPEDVPSHINFTAYFPQNDLLAHKRTMLLITNGGMMTILEAMAHGVPIVGLPLYGNNKYNLNKVVNKGFGVIVEKSNLSKSTLLKAIKEVLEVKKYRATAKELSKLWKDRIETPFDVALRYIEHVARNGGARFLKPPQRTLDYLQPLNLDFYAVLMAIVIAYLKTKTNKKVKMPKKLMNLYTLNIL